MSGTEPLPPGREPRRRQHDDWRDHAACLDEDPELFFPISADGPGAAQIARAKAICADCPVRQQCLEFALRTGQDYGVWGGLDADERRALRARRLAASVDAADAR